MPTLTEEKLAKLDAVLKQKGSSLAAERPRLERLFVTGEKDASASIRNDILLTKMLGPTQRPREPFVPLAQRNPELAEALDNWGQKPKMPESPLKAGLGAFAQGVVHAAKPAIGVALPGVIPKWRDKFADVQTKAIEGVAGEAMRENPKLSGIARTAGEIAPLLAIPGAAFSTPLKAAGTGAVMGALGTEGGAKEKGIAAAVSAGSFGLGTKVNLALKPFIGRLQGKLLAMGMDANAATQAAVRFAPKIQTALTDATAFTALAAVEQEARSRIEGTGKMPLDELFLTNLGTILVAHGMGAAMPKPKGARFAEGRQRVELRDAMAAEAGGASANIARQEALKSGADALIVHAAYKDALRGKGWTPAEANILARSGPAALRRKVAPERVADLFEPDMPKPGAAEPVAAPIGSSPSARSQRIYQAQAEGARAVVETQKARAAATVRASTLRTNAEMMEREAARQEAVATKAATEVATRGAVAEGPVVTRAIEALDPQRPVGDTATRVKKLEADAARLDELAGRIETRAGAEETGPARLALDLPNIARPLRERFHDPNVAKKMRLRAQELRDEAGSLREQGFKEEAKTTAPGVRARQPQMPDFEGPARAAREWKAKAQKARQDADAIELKAEADADFALDRAKRARMDAMKRDPDAEAIAGILPADSAGAAKMKDISAQDAVVLARRLAESKVAASPDEEFNIPQTAENARALADDLAATPPGEPGAEMARASGQAGQSDIGRVMPWDYLRQLERTAPKILGEPLAKEFVEKATVASWKTRTMKHLVRTAAASKFRKWSAWLEVLSPKDQAAAIDRFVNLTEQGKTTGAHPIETEFLTFWNRIMRGYANVIEAQSGKPLALKGRYLSHIFETLEATTTGQAQRAAQQILGEWKGSVTRQPGGSRFLHARQSSRQDFVRDVFFLFDAYINSMTPALHWKPVENWLSDLRKPGGAFDKIMAEKMMATKGDIKEGKKLKAKMDDAESFLKKHVAAGMGRQESWLGIADALDAGLSAIGRGVGLKPRAPYRNLMRAYTYAQYVGGLGLNVGSSLRNLTQNINTISEVGPTWWGKAMTLLAEVGAGGKPEINRLLKHAHINDSALARDVRTQVQSMFGRNLSELGGAIGDTTMTLFTAAEYVNRSTAYLAGYLKAKSQGLGEKAAREYGRRIVSRTQFDYSPGLGGLIYSGPFTHALFQFARFPVYQFDYLSSVIGRAVSGKTAGMLPGDSARAPALRLAVATLATSPLMAALGMDFNDSYGIGGVPAPVKFAATKAAEGLAGDSFEARLKARKIMRRVGLEPYETTIGESARRMFGPIYQQSESAWDWLWGDERESALAAKDLGRNLTVLFPGLAAHRIKRFMQEYDDKQVRNTRTGDVMFPITDGDAWARLAGINSTNVIEGYENIRDRTLRERTDAGMKANLYDDVRQMYRELKAAGDPDYAEKAAAKYFAGLREIYADTAIAPPQDPGQSFRENVVEKVEIGERTTREQRMKPVIDRSDILGPEGGK